MSKFTDIVKEAEDNLFKPASAADVAARGERRAILMGEFNSESMNGKLVLRGPNYHYGGFSMELKFDRGDSRTEKRYDVDRPTATQLQPYIDRIKTSPEYSNTPDDPDLKYDAQQLYFDDIRKHICAEIYPEFKRFDDKMKEVMLKHGGKIKQ